MIQGRDKQSSLFGQSVSYKELFYDIFSKAGSHCFKRQEKEEEKEKERSEPSFSNSQFTLGRDKLACLSMAKHFRPSLTSQLGK
jgi:hypothetical protein